MPRCSEEELMSQSLSLLQTDGGAGGGGGLGQRGSLEDEEGREDRQV